MRLQNVRGIAMVIGAMKSGTTSLFWALKGHPQLAIAPTKEVNFFACPERWGRGPDWYDSQFSFDPSVHRWALDGSTDQTKFPYTDYALDRMQRFDDVRWKFLYLIRHPLRRIESHHRHAHQTGAELLRFQALDQDFSFDHRISPVAIDVSRYAFQLDHYAERWGKDSVKIVVFEELIKDWENQVRSIRQFLEIDDSLPIPEKEHQNNRSQRTVPSESYKALRSIAPLRALGSMVPKTAKHALRDRMINPDELPRFKLNAAEEVELLDKLRGDLRRLHDVYGVDVEGNWGISLS